ncbi:MAG: succinate dehydrogenase, cytochrome b556 subunit [Chloroflexi bacterium]|nr:succinate dehydrogenase, cytochrome b556 subunit [Chloroflexota bacterium]
MSVIESVWKGITYRGGVGHWAWLLHRVAGVGVALFLTLHILDIFLISFGEEVFEKLLFIYHSLLFKPFIVLLVFGVTYHALNGLRLILIDFWPGVMTEYHKPAWYAAVAISVVVTLINIVVML